MSDHRAEFRPIAFPHAAPTSGGATSEPVSNDLRPAEPHLGTHSLGGYIGKDRCEPEDDFCDETYRAAPPSMDDSPIAGRIGTPQGEPRAGDLVEQVLRLGQRLRGHLDGRFGTFGLSDARFAALSVIREAAPAGCTQAHLAAKLGQCESSISTLVERMRASHLLYRLRAKADRRKRVLMLTEEGRALLEQGLACRDREAQVLFSGMTSDEQQQLSKTLASLFGTLDRLADDSTQTGIERPAA